MTSKQPRPPGTFLLWLIRRVLTIWIACATYVLVVAPTQTMRLTAGDLVLLIADGRKIALLAGSLVGSALLLAWLTPRRPRPGPGVSEGWHPAPHQPAQP